MVEKLPKQKTVQIMLTPESRRIIENLRDDTGIPNTESMARILEWFAGLDRKLRLAILNRDEETRNELALLAAESITKKHRLLIVDSENRNDASLLARNDLTSGKRTAHK